MPSANSDLALTGVSSQDFGPPGTAAAGIFFPLPSNRTASASGSPIVLARNGLRILAVAWRQRGAEHDPRSPHRPRNERAPMNKLIRSTMTAALLTAGATMAFAQGGAAGGASGGAGAGTAGGGAGVVSAAVQGLAVPGQPLRAAGPACAVGRPVARPVARVVAPRASRGAVEARDVPQRANVAVLPSETVPNAARRASVPVRRSAALAMTIPTVPAVARMDVARPVATASVVSRVHGTAERSAASAAPARPAVPRAVSTAPSGRSFVNRSPASV